ncbi:hypothetical protein LCGC14_0943140 [marine sediment metagenome]|uniref:Uncharacterized protein n=1 Tax=marine sediment metagenome TaxID=412755 RepID=A0A0F9RQS3_9ZZZZ
MPQAVIELQNRILANEREIRRLRALLDYLATGDGLRAIRIVGLIPPENLPPMAGALLTYISFGDEPISGQVEGTATIYSADMIVQVS